MSASPSILISDYPSLYNYAVISYTGSISGTLPVSNGDWGAFDGSPGVTGIYPSADQSSYIGSTTTDLTNLIAALTSYAPVAQPFPSMGYNINVVPGVYSLTGSNPIANSTFTLLGAGLSNASFIFVIPTTITLTEFSFINNGLWPQNVFFIASNGASMTFNNCDIFGTFITQTESFYITGTGTDPLTANIFSYLDVVVTSIPLLTGMGATATGVTGTQGPTGDTGPQGPTGASGAIGDTGPQGPTGASGTNGVDGAAGAIGDTGPQGPTGASGTNGVDSAASAIGDTGPQGPTGASGTNGIDGASGINGIDGAVGANGVDGIAGLQGPPGPPGPPGPSSSIACFLKGTKILTARGYKVVEELEFGDKIVTKGDIVDGCIVNMKTNSVPISWISKFNVKNLTKNSYPICISANAFAKNFPNENLYVSPDHGILIKGSMVQAKDLVNGQTIYQDLKSDFVTYYHVELDPHSVIIAHGILTESYMSTEIRSIFQSPRRINKEKAKQYFRLASKYA